MEGRREQEGEDRAHPEQICQIQNRVALEQAKNDAGEIERGLKQKRGAVEDQSKTALE